MKIKNKQKGFTLIELMVVMSIIALLSSIIFASIKTVRENALITKTVSEMKSLQNAVELYKNNFGYYPDERNGDLSEPGILYIEEDSYNPGWGNNLTGGGGYMSIIKDYLVDNKYIATAPHAPNYPNNCQENACVDNGYLLGYSTDLGDISSGGYYYMCGDQIVSNYVIFLYANTKKINLPILKNIYPGYNPNNDFLAGIPDRYTYCISQ